MIPGHGGFMDRMDSIVAVAVVAGMIALRDRSARSSPGSSVRRLMSQGPQVGVTRSSRLQEPGGRSEAGDGAQAPDHPRRDRLHRQEHARSRRAPARRLRDRGAHRAEQRRRARARPRARPTPSLAVIGDPGALRRAQGAACRAPATSVAAGPAAVIAAAAEPADCVLAAIVGAAGLEPTFEAARQGRRVALANKECLVSAGEVFMSAVALAGAELLPVDSEHSAALQALAGAEPESIETIVLTASGGPFRTWERRALARAPRRRRRCAIPTGRWAPRSPSIPPRS